MAFYDLAKHERTELVEVIKATIFQNLRGSGTDDLISYFADEDTYIRKAAYLSIGRIYFETSQSAPLILKLLKNLLQHDDFKVRQTTINAAGEIGKRDFEVVEEIFSKGLFDQHHSPRNAVIGSIKKMAEVNPVPVLNWTKKFLHHPDKEIRREICHGIELRGRKHPQDILPLLKELEFDKTTRVRNTLVHVIGQIAYKKGCLEIVVDELKNWQNQKLVIDALEEIIDVHHRYRNFSVKTQEEARQYIQEHFGLFPT